MTPPEAGALAGAAVSAALEATEADRAALAKVLARPEFRDRLADGQALRRLLLGWWDRLLALLETPEAERYADLGRLVFLAAAAAAAALLWRAARRRAAARAQARRARGGAATAGGAEATPDPGRRLAEAERALAAGDAALAVRAAFGAAAAAFAPASAPGRGGALTGAELAALAGEPSFADLARLHERTLFGRRAPSAGEAARSVEVARRLLRPPASPGGAGGGA